MQELPRCLGLQEMVSFFVFSLSLLYVLIRPILCWWRPIFLRVSFSLLYVMIRLSLLCSAVCAAPGWISVTAMFKGLVLC
jgi:hypothetical protein